MILVRRDAWRARSVKIARPSGIAQRENRARNGGEAIAMEADRRPARLAMASKERPSPLDRGIDGTRSLLAQPIEKPPRAGLLLVIEILMRDDVPPRRDRGERGF